MLESFYTIDNNSEGYYEEKASKFISYAYSVKTENQVNEIILKNRKMHKFARHIAYSYIIIENDNNVKKKYSDDGEPQKTAGFPLMNILEKKNLNNVLLVVVRYFGGTLLGTSLLTRAYLNSGKDAIDKCKIIIKNIAKEITINTEYRYIDSIVNTINKLNGNVKNILYGDKVLIFAKIPKQNSITFIKSISNYAKETDIIVKGECYI